MFMDVKIHGEVDCDHGMHMPPRATRFFLLRPVS